MYACSPRSNPIYLQSVKSERDEDLQTLGHSSVTKERNRADVWCGWGRLYQRSSAYIGVYIRLTVCVQYSESRRVQQRVFGIGYTRRLAIYGSGVLRPVGATRPVHRSAALIEMASVSYMRTIRFGQRSTASCTVCTTAR